MIWKIQHLGNIISDNKQNYRKAYESLTIYEQIIINKWKLLIFCVIIIRIFESFYFLL